MPIRSAAKSAGDYCRRIPWELEGLESDLDEHLEEAAIFIEVEDQWGRRGSDGGLRLAAKF